MVGTRVDERIHPVVLEERRVVCRRRHRHVPSVPIVPARLSRRRRCPSARRRWRRSRRRRSRGSRRGCAYCILHLRSGSRCRSPGWSSWSRGRSWSSWSRRGGRSWSGRSGRRGRGGCRLGRGGLVWSAGTARQQGDPQQRNSHKDTRGLIQRLHFSILLSYRLRILDGSARFAPRLYCHRPTNPVRFKNQMCPIDV